MYQRHRTFWLLAVVLGIGCPTGVQAEKTSAKEEPLCLDIARFHVKDHFRAPVLASFLGRQVIDGLPFDVGGEARLFGQTPASRGEKTPYTLDGIRIGRRFDELHLIHHAAWADVEGQTIAYVCLNYDDGTKFIFPIRYGVHVRDWFHLPSYEKDSVTDPDTEVCWRHVPVQYKAPIRLWKSTFANPSPEKVVKTMDVVSARNLASYDVVAATVANRESARVVAPTADRQFDGKLRIRVVDEVTGAPIDGALVEPSMSVDGEGVIGAPFYTSSSGKGAIRYPVGLTSSLSACVKKEGYVSKSEGWNGDFPRAFTFRLAPKGDQY
jgi:hypothetical protein